MRRLDGDAGAPLLDPRPLLRVIGPPLGRLGLASARICLAVRTVGPSTGRFGRLAGRNAAKRAQGAFESATEPVKTHREVLAEQQGDDAAAESSTSLAGDYADGTYEGTGQGYGGKISLSVTVEGGRVTGVEVLECSETATIGELALPVYCEDAATADNTDDIDVASGASNTLRGFKAALADALARA